MCCSHRDDSINKHQREVMLDPNVRDSYATGVKGEKKFSGKSGTAVDGGGSASAAPALPKVSHLRVVFPSSLSLIRASCIGRIV